MKRYLILLLCALFSPALLAAPLSTEVYNPQDKGLFAVSSTLVSGPREAILFDAQFSVRDGEKLVEMIRRSGKTLTRIVITSGDPDFYFGIEPIVNAFPNVPVVASRRVVDHINATKDTKLAFWGPQMKDGAPQRLYVPQALAETRLRIDGETLELRHPDSYAAYVWIPSIKTILGGTAISSGIHVWTADTQSAASRDQWRDVLQEMIGLHPQQVIPGHYLGARPAGDRAIIFTRDYLQSFARALSRYQDSAGVIRAMQDAWPELAEESSLELSAKVNTGEMSW
ncbi:Vmh family MBL fold metallo-hydrolase [Entomohabitans teleogrylli]|uniref:Vmh family MBL fold metallo-hydrolase n=1 Tax=Entomohabitans teleogrylli TaxID=1384589 RepID=UPI00073D95B4|nr:Vmh family MBL fold metallo-hydrolase [Entomohabitans teleogrylli]